ncbi:MAG: prolyl oligopeptidase family serine peptidase [Gemmatimonadetes bacterium]|nr:prolyl oligopeptidase family serine peptidase [Gemmatimonadota bacterium]
MRLTHFARAAFAVAICSTLAAAQRGGGNAQNAANTNPQTNLPYAAPSADPVSKWTPPASVGRQLTLNDLITWKGVRGPQLSNDGKWFAYIIAPNEGDGEVVARGTAAGAQEMRFPIGAVAGGGGRGGAGGVSISGNNRWLAFNVLPGSDTTGRGARGGRGAGGAAGGAGAAAANASPKLAVVDLTNGSKREYESVRAFRFAGDNSNWVAIHHAVSGGGGAAAGGAAAGGRGAGGRGAGGGGGAAASMLELVDLAGSGIPMQIANVSEFEFNTAGTWVAYAVSVPDQIGNSVQLRELASGVTRPLDVQKASYQRITWGDSSSALAALRVVRDTAGGDDQTTVVAWMNAVAMNARPVEIGATSAGVMGGLVVSTDRALQWGDGQTKLYFGLREARPPRDTPAGRGGVPPSTAPAPGAGAGGQIAAAPQTDAEVPSLILWHWKDPRTQSTQQVQETQDRAFSYLAAYDFAGRKVTKLADDRVRNVSVGPKDTWGVGIDIADYERDQSIRGFSYGDVYAVNIGTGERKVVQKKVPGGGGRGGASFSPDNNKFAYYDTGDWKVYDFANGATTTVTKGVPAQFWNTEDDHNQVKPGIGGGFVGWSSDGNHLLLRDNWDVWRVPVSGTGALNLTGNGKKDEIRYQAREIFDPRQQDDGIDLSKPIYFETYGEWTKKEGLSMVDGMKGGATPITFEDAKVDYRRARDANTWVYSRQTVVKYPDWYAADDGITGERRLTDANPQQKDVAWSAGAVLINYTCDNGLGRRQAALFLPAGYEKGKKYPTLTYIYEKLSQGMHVYPAPNATRYSNPAVYTSRGYAFLQPDIAYKLNEPGRSAVWCVVPAVKAAIAAGYVDADRVGLQGHSWGGYQSSFITTQTNIFKTAVAGAPLTDMTSMFGSIYWNSGNTDGSIFIASQGRFTGGPNEVPEAYDRNSPQKYAQNLSIPFMILHNDRDGAVDFNQGITYYNHLRTLDKDVVLLEYVGENHGLARPANQKDYALRMTEWFDTFLRDQPAPEWLKEGVPRLRMEEHLKDRRVMVDPKATKAVPRITP